MLAYAATRTQPVQRRSAPHAMLAIIAAHVGLLAAVMSAKMELPDGVRNSPLVIELIHEDDPPPPNVIQPRTPAAPQPSRIDHVQPVVPMPAPDMPQVDTSPVPLPDMGQMVRPLPDSRARVDPVPSAPVRSAPQLLTRAADLKPPYPASKLSSGEEAVLRLRLSIDPSGRVTAVEPVGPADRAFLEAARRHLLARWRYKPASEDGRAIASSTIITLRFQLEG